MKPLEACVPVQVPQYVPGQIARPYLESAKAATWVKLLELPSEYSYNEALLLCPISKEEWVAWIPDYGEAVLHIKQFCRVH